MAGYLSRFTKLRQTGNEPHTVAAPPAEQFPGVLHPADAQAALLPRAMFDATQYFDMNPDVAARDRPLRLCCPLRLQKERLGRRRSVPAKSRALSTRVRPQGNLIERIVDLEADKRVLFEAWDRHLHRVTNIGFDDLAEPVDDAIAPPLDRSDCDETALDPGQKFWSDNGYIIKPGFIPGEMLDRYTAIRQRHPAVNG
jgi:hypothetical protein